MKSLNQIISSIDEQLAQVQEFDSSPASHFIFGEQEKMRRYVLVSIGLEKLAIPIDGLSEISHMPEITSLPGLPSWIYGIANRRGEIVSVIDLNNLLIPERAPVAPGAKLGVLFNESLKVGISIDQVIATVSRPESDRVANTDSRLAQAFPEVFSKGLQVDSTIYQILAPDLFLGLENLHNYQANG